VYNRLIMAKSLPAPAQGAPEITCNVGEFAAGEGSRGVAPSWVFNVTLSGQATIYAEGRQIVLSAGQCALLRPNVPQDWSVPRDPSAGGKPHWNCIYSAFTPRPHWNPWLKFVERVDGYSVWRMSSARLTQQVVRGMKKIHEHVNGAVVTRMDFALNEMEKVLLTCWTDQSAGALQIDPRVRQAMEYLSAHSTEAVKLAWLAQRCHISRSHLASLFRKQVGIPPLQFQEGQRLERATQMLRMTIEPISRIAFDLGFEDPHYFSRRFRKHTGVSPREYRARFQKMKR
jgi:AraC family transcriptional regulator, arabinose operon regulatory protein